MTYAELESLLANTGYPVALPGEQNVGLPAYTINPLGITVEELFPVAYEVCEVNCRVAYGENNSAQWDESRRMVYAAMNEFRGTPVQFDAEIDVATDIDTEPPSIAYTVRVQFPGEPICEDVLHLVDVNAEIVTYLIA